MARFSRGKQLRTRSQINASEERKKLSLERQKAKRQEDIKSTSKKLIVIFIIILVGLVVFERHLIHISSDGLEQSYSSTINNYFKENPLQRSRLFFTSKEFTDYIINEHPEIRSVELQNNIIATSKIIIDKKEPAFLWQNAEAVYIGDNQGVIYSSENLDLKLPTIVDPTNLVVNAGDQVTSSNVLDYISKVDENLSANKLVVDKFSLPSNSRQIDVFIVNSTFYIKFSLDRDVVGQIAELNKVLRFTNNNNIAINDYIDLRVVDKVFYK